MKTSTIILAALLMMNNLTEARILANTISYEGAVIAHFELPEVEIKGEKIHAKQAERKVPARSTRYMGETISEIDLPEVVINETYIEPINAKSISILHVPATADGPVVQEIDNNLKKDEAKKPFFHLLANKIYDAGFKFLQTVSEGLFFRS